MTNDLPYSTVAGPFRRHTLPWTWPFSKCSSSSQLPKKSTQIAFSRVFNMFNRTHTGDPWPAVFGEGISCTAFRPNHCNSSWFSSILDTRQRTQQFAGRSTFSHRLPPYPQLPTLNVQEATTLRLQNTPAFPLESNCFVSLSAPMCLNVLRTSHCCICRLETVLATSSCDADPISTPNWSRKRHRAQGWMATSWLWYMNMCDKFCWDNPTWGRSENQRFKDPLSPMSFVCWFL